MIFFFNFLKVSTSLNCIFFYLKRKDNLGRKDEGERDGETRSAVSGRLGRGIAQARSVYLNLYVPCVIRKTRAPFEFRRLLPSNVPRVSSFPRGFAFPRLAFFSKQKKKRNRKESNEIRDKFNSGDEPCTSGRTLKMARSMIRSRVHGDTRIRRFLDRWRGWRGSESCVVCFEN